MTALAVSDWTVVINKTLIKAGQRETHCTLTYGDGALTYPTAGIPLPTAATLGMQRNIDNLIIVDSALNAATTTAYMYEWDKSNHLLKIYVDEDPAGVATAPFVEAATGVTPAASTLEIIVQGW